MIVSVGTHRTLQHMFKKINYSVEKRTCQAAVVLLRERRRFWHHHLHIHKFCDCQVFMCFVLATFNAVTGICSFASC